MNYETHSLDARSIRARRIFRTTVLFGATFYFGAVLASPQYSALELSELRETAIKKSYVNVLIGLSVDNSLAAIAKRKPTSSSYDKEISAVLKPLEGTYLPATLWKSLFGQFSVYINEQGLRKILESEGVKIISRAPSQDNMYGSEEELLEIEKEIINSGTAKVKIFPTKSSLNWSIAADGAAAFKPSVSDDRSKVADVDSFARSFARESYVGYSDNSAREGLHKSAPDVLGRPRC